MNEDASAFPEDQAEPVGIVLARMRKARRITGAQLGRQVGMSQPKISRLENGIGLPEPADVRLIAQALGAGADEVERLVGIAERSHNLMTDMRPSPVALASRQVNVGEEERTATTIRTFQPDLIIGLLQTSEYARAILYGFQRLARPSTGPPAELAVAAAVSERIRRQEVLTDHTKQFHFLLTETALANRLCPPEHMPAQIRRIRDVAAQQNVTISIIPADFEWPIAPAHGFTLLDENKVVIDLYNTGVSSEGKTDGRIFLQVFDAYAEQATDDIDPILDRFLRHYLDSLHARDPR